jgi:hypothetical protein
MVVAATEARFGEKVYADIVGAVQQAAEQPAQNLTSGVMAQILKIWLRRYMQFLRC